MSEANEDSMQEKRGQRFLELGKDVLTYGFMAGLSRLTGFLLLPLFTRIFSTDEYGTIDIVLTATSLAGVFVRLSLPSAIQRYFSECEGSRDERRLVSTLLFFVAFVGAGVLLVVGLLSKQVSALIFGGPQQASFVLLGFLSAIFSALSSIPQAVLRMERRIVRFNLLKILYSASHAGLALYLVFVRSLGVAGVLIGSVLASVLQLIVALAWTRQFLTTKLSYDTLARSLAYSLPLLPAVMVTWINKQADRFVLLTFLGLSGVGVFGAASRIATAVQLPATIFRSAWSPYAMSLIDTDSRRRNRFYERALSYYVGGFACLGLVLTAIGPEILKVLVAAEYQQGFVVIPWLAGAAILHYSGAIVNMGVLINEKTYVSSIADWSGVVLNVLLAVALIPHFGIQGAGIGVFVAELVAVGIRWHFTVKFSEIRFHRESLIGVLIGYVTTSAFLLWCGDAVRGPILSFICRMLALAGAAFLILRLTIEESAWRALRASLARLSASVQRRISSIQAKRL